MLDAESAREGLPLGYSGLRCLRLLFGPRRNAKALKLCAAHGAAGNASYRECRAQVAFETQEMPCQCCDVVGVRARGESVVFADLRVPCNVVAAAARARLRRRGHIA